MTEEQYIELDELLERKLKEKLEISVNYDKDYVGHYIEVKLIFDNSVISKYKARVDYNSED